MRNRLLTKSQYTKIAACGLLLLSAGCSRHHTMQPAEAVKLDPERLEVAGIEKFDVTIPKAKYKAAFTQKGNVNSVRLVQVFTRGDEGPSRQEYRIFDVRPGSAYELLGLANGDVIIAANDWTLNNPSKFSQYAYLLQNEKAGHLEIRRAGRPLLLNFTFSE